METLNNEMTASATTKKYLTVSFVKFCSFCFPREILGHMRIESNGINIITIFISLTANETVCYNKLNENTCIIKHLPKLWLLPMDNLKQSTDAKPSRECRIHHNNSTKKQFDLLIKSN